MSTRPETTPAALGWGRRYLAVSPDHFRIDYAINPFMKLDDQPDPVRTREQWVAMVAAIEAAGAEVEVLGQMAHNLTSTGGA